MAAKPVPARARNFRTRFTFVVCLAIFSSMALPADAQKEKKKKKDSKTAAEPHTTIPMGDEQQIDYKISEMLGAWQLGDLDRLHQDYADDAVFVSGTWPPPVFGWPTLLPLSQHHPPRIHQVPLNRP